MGNEIRNGEFKDTVETNLFVDETIVNTSEENITNVEEVATIELSGEEIMNNTIISEVVTENVVEDVNSEIVNEENQNEENIELKVGIVIPDHLNIRKEASKDSDIVGMVNKDDELQITNELEDFYEVLFNGVKCFCVKNFISIK